MKAKPNMKIKELIAMLQKYDGEREIIFSWQEDDVKEGYGIRENVISEDESTFEVDATLDEIETIQDCGFDYITVFLTRSMVERGKFEGVIERGEENE